MEDNVHLGGHCRRGLDRHNIHYHDRVLHFGQAAHKKRAQVKIFSRKCIFYMEICSCCKNDHHKLTFIPVVFVLEHIWGTIRFFLLLKHFCEQGKLDSSLQWLEILHGIGINSQGFTNFILFFWCTTKIRERLIIGCVQCLSFLC